MITIEGEEKKPQLWPGASLANFGQNPYGGNLWRVAWSESINHMVGARWAKDGFVGYRYISAYLGKKCYVLERWLSPFQFAKCDATGWDIMHRDPDTGLNRLGPYPSRGVYFGPCWEFDGYPTLSAIESVIQIILRCDEYSDAEKAMLQIRAQETEFAMEKRAAKEIILESLPTNITKGTFLPSAMKRAEDIPERFSAEDMVRMNKLRVGEGKSFTVASRGA